MVSDLVGRLGEVDKHCVLVQVLSLGVVPDSVAVHTICVLVYQHVPARTCTRDHDVFYTQLLFSLVTYEASFYPHDVLLQDKNMAILPHSQVLLPVMYRLHC